MVITRIREKVLALFLSDPSKTYTIREVALHTKIHYRQVYQEVIELEKQEVLVLEKKGSSKICSINLPQNASLYAYIESIRASSFLKDHPPLRVIINELKSMQTQYYTLILFGSLVQSKARKSSDIDLLFIIPKNTSVEKFEQEVSSRLHLLHYPYDINVITEESFMEMGKEKILNLRNEIIKNHIILDGAEAYYRLLAP